MSTQTIVKVEGIRKRYPNGVCAVDGFEQEFEKGKFYALMGASGSGKSTMLNIIGSLDEPTEGTVAIGGAQLDGMSEKEKAALRRENIGFVFQGFYLNPNLNAKDNVVVPMLVNPEYRDKKKREARAEELLEQFGMADRAKHFPRELSGGEQQRIAIARALANHPEIILADEPTGNLDEENEKLVFHALKALTQEGICVIAVSHNDEIRNYADEVIELKKGTRVQG